MMFAFAGALSASACASEGSEPGTSTVGGAYSALAAELAACGQEMGACMQAAAGDAAAVEACRAEHTACREAAEPQVDALADAANPCAEHARTCFPAAKGDQQAIAACREELASCLGVEANGNGGDRDGAMPDLPDAAMGPDGRGPADRPDAAMGMGTDTGMGSGRPADAGMSNNGGQGLGQSKDCINTLLDCIAAGDDAATCAGEVRACVLDSLPAPAANAMASDGGMAMGPPDNVGQGRGNNPN